MAATTRATLMALLTVSVACTHQRGASVGGDADVGLHACGAPAAAGEWSWKTARIGTATVDIPTPFVHRTGGDTRTQVWEYGPRQIVLELSTDPNVTRGVPHFRGQCALQVADREVEVVSSLGRNSDRVVTALVPNVDGGLNLVARITTPYPNEIDALWRVLTSVRVSADKAGGSGR